jgi:hypothetical protein
VTTISGVLDNAAGARPVTNYQATAGKGRIENHVDTWKYVPGVASDGTFTRPDGTYQLIQWHIHSLSEHRINKVAYAAEIHCNFFNSNLSCPCQGRCRCYFLSRYRNNGTSGCCFFSICFHLC